MSDIDISSIDPRTLSRDEFARLLQQIAERGRAAAAADGAPTTGSGLDPKTFSRLVRLASPEQLDAVMSDPAVRAPVLAEIFARMASRFRPENAPRRDSAVHWRITKGEGEEPDVYETWIAGGTCATSATPQHEPRVALTMAGDQFLNLVSGNASPVVLFMTGKVKLDGDLGFAAALGKIFDIPKG